MNVLEHFQIQNEEGPYLDAFGSGETVMHDDLRDDNPWPGFARLALDAGFYSVHAFPMMVRTNVLGTLNLFMDTPGPQAEDDVVVAQALAHAATVPSAESGQLGFPSADDSTARGVQQQNHHRAGKGMISELGHINTDEAFVRMRTFSRAHNEKLTEVATRIVNRQLLRPELPELFYSDPPL
jgi:hypothetical protein